MTKFARSAVIFFSLLFFATSGCVSAPVSSSKGAGSADKGVFHAWSQYGPDSILLGRVITTDKKCPSLEADGRFIPMLERSVPTAQFPVRSCEVIIPAGTHDARVLDSHGYQQFPLLNHPPHKVVVLGDTGCRIKLKNGKGEVQDCNDPKQWPFLQIADIAAKSKPDLVIHVGDYLYRESPCPKDPATGKELAQCAGSPWGYGSDVWDADFFTPAKQLLQTAPWVFVRGNHELCSRAGEGWFRYLDARVYTGTCLDRTPVFSVNFENMNLAILDSAAAEDDEAKDADVKYYSTQIAAIETFGKHQWVLTHRPIWALFGKKDREAGSLNKTLQESARTLGTMMEQSQIDLVLAGHIHLFETLTFQDKGPSQLVLGNGGTELSEYVPEAKTPFYAGIPIDDRKVRQATILKDFGYLVLEFQKNGDWNAVAYSKAGTLIDRFRLHEKDIQKLR